MKTRRDFIAACLAASALLIPAASLPVAEATPVPGNQQGQHRVYWVYYRTSVHSQWVNYGGYYNQSHAVQAVNYFRSRGCDAYYR